METCGRCMGSGYGGHPDSGAVCADCNGSGGILDVVTRLRTGLITHATREEAADEIERLREVLAFYANPYLVEGSPWAASSDDYGRRARLALEQNKPETRISEHPSEQLPGATDART